MIWDEHERDLQYLREGLCELKAKLVNFAKCACHALVSVLHDKKSCLTDQTKDSLEALAKLQNDYDYWNGGYYWLMTWKNWEICRHVTILLIYVIC